MAGKSIDMSKLRKVLKLHIQGKSKKFISGYLNLSRNTVAKYISKFIQLKLTIEDLSKYDDAKLEELFINTEHRELSPKLKQLYSFFPYVEKELKKTGVTKGLLWQEYKTKYPDGVQSTQFCEHYNRWSKRINVKPVMHMVHKAGDKMFVDYAGKTLQVVDKNTGELKEVQFFAAILGASQMTYAEASFSQKKVDFINSVENALHFYQGVPAAIVTDNLKSAVKKSNRYEPTLNETFLDFSEHYGTTILPARAYRPRDKALVEGVIKILYTRVYTALAKETFFSIDKLNEAIKKLMIEHNRQLFSGKKYSRKDLFDEIESPKLMLLPQQKYEFKQQAIVTVMQNGHVLLGEDKHYYSVPYQYIRKKVKLLYTSSVIEVYHKYNRIAIHKRLKSPFNYTTNKEHLASTHKYMTEWTPQRFINWAKSIDENVEKLIVKILERKLHPEQAYKSCMGVLSLAKKVGNERLINACERALDYQVYNYKIVQNILEKGLDKAESKIVGNEPNLPQHNNIRGKEYYK